MESITGWRPTASIEKLRLRAAMFKRIRAFFDAREVMEVETPILSNATVSDIYLKSFETHYVGPGTGREGKKLFLQTSPEFAMKRLLAAGSGPIFQFARSFRNEEAGRYHNPEFTMLEWYRPGFDHHDLMEEMKALLMEILWVSDCDKMTWQHAFIKYTNTDPLDANFDTLKALARRHSSIADLADKCDYNELLQIIFSTLVEPQIGKEQPCFIYNFPASQAALARICPDDPRVAERFEVYFKGVELANGFHELTDSDEQRRRFIKDNEYRAANNLSVNPVDENLLDALTAGMPACAGVALGMDRLFMLFAQLPSIAEGISFSVENA